MADPFAVNGPLRKLLRTAPHAAVRAGLPPAALGYRWVEKRPLDAESAAEAGGSYEILAAERTEANALPVNVARRTDLPDEAGWWGYSFRDVPARRSGETALVTLPEATIAFARDARGNLHPGLLACDGTALSLREIDLRAHHAPSLRGTARTRLSRVVWIWERVYDNYSHWLSAHLPKLRLLRDLDLLDDLALPAERPAFIDESLRIFGVDPARLQSVPLDTPLEAATLTLLVTDRFRPDLLQGARMATAIGADGPPHRKVFVSRRRAKVRSLLNEDEIWPLFREAGYERVEMETLSFTEQRALMGRTCALAGPHGAGLTNQLFCPPGARVLEIADPAFPNPNFYAMAAGLGHAYAIVGATSEGGGHPLFKDLRVDPDRVRTALAALNA
jgi:hypothetical protein